MKPAAVLLLVLAAGAGLCRAQTSASYKLTESSLDDGGDPRDGSFAASASHRIRLDALGQAVNLSGPASASFHLDAGFAAGYPPPTEVRNLHWTDPATLVWDPEKSTGRYELYRDLISTLPGGFGACFQSGIAGETWSDAGTPPIGAGWFYLVTARNLIAEEGTKGFRSSGAERTNPAPCP